MMDAPLIGDHVDLLPLEMYLLLLNGYSFLPLQSWLQSMSGGLGVSGAESMILPWRFIKQQSKSSGSEQDHHHQTRPFQRFSLHPSILTPQIDFQSDQIDTQAFSYSTFKKTEQIGTMIPYGARSRS
jgi:hypothetical protein